MDKAIQDNKELQAEELYALLDKAWETEPRLCVSEELIQKTLKRAAEETDNKVVSFETAKKRSISPVKYMGVAVAALFVAVVGVRMLGNGGFVAKDAQMEAAPGNMASESESVAAYDGSGLGIQTMDSADAEEKKWYSSRSGNGADLHADADADKEDVFEASEENHADVSADVQVTEIEKGTVEMSAMTVTLSQRLADVLKDAGMTSVSGEAECFEFAATDADWERELLNCLAAGELWDNGRPEDYGTYRYVLESTDEVRYEIEYREPLDMILRIETEKGTLWGLLGEGSYFFTE